MLGGYTERATAQLADGALYDAGTGAWTAIAPLSSAIAGSAVASDGGRLWSWGGQQGTTRTANGFVYDVALGSWSTLPASPLHAVSGAEAAWTGSSVVVFGGSSASSVYDELAIFTP